MEFLKSLTFILWNIALGWSIIYLIKWFLFNTRQRYFLGLRIPLTPGLVIRKRDWLFNKARNVLHDYLEQANNPQKKDGYLAKLERMIYAEAIRQTRFIKEWKLLPRKWQEKLREHIAQIVLSVARRIIRRLIPELVAKYRLEYRIEEYNEQFNAKLIYSYFHRYIYRYLRYFVVGISLLIGITNMIWYLILLLL